MPQTKTFNNFGGGITDNDVPGNDIQYKKADNLEITQDLKLDQRPGSQILSNTEYQLPGGNHRVSKLVNFDSDSELLGAMGTKFYYRSAGSWTSLLGPSSGDPFTLNDFNTQIHESQWQKHLFLVSESGNKPLKLYKDGSSNWQLRTAGMPAISAAVTGWADNGLADAIALANDLRSKMITHYGNATASPSLPDTTYAHRTSSDLTTQASSVTASVAATNLATLITLMGVLRSNFDTHVRDILQASFTVPAYHIATGSSYAASVSEASLLNFRPKDPDNTLSGYTILQLIPYLNDLRDKWNYHSYGIHTHFNAWKDPQYPSATSVNTGFGLHKTSVYPVNPTAGLAGSAHTNLLLSPNITSLLQWCTDLKSEYDAHRVYQYHMISDSFNTLPSQVSTAPVILADILILAVHLAQVIWRHSADSTYRWGGATAAEIGLLKDATIYPRILGNIYLGTTTGGNATIASVTPDPSVNIAPDGSAYGVEPYVFLSPIAQTNSNSIWNVLESAFNTNQLAVTPSFPTPYRITATTGSSISMSHVAAASHTNTGYSVTHSYFHYNTQAEADFLSPEKIANALNNLDLSFSTYPNTSSSFYITTSALTALGTFVKSCSTALKAHELSKQTLYTATSLPDAGLFKLDSGNDRTIYYQPIDLLSVGIPNLAVHYPWFSAQFAAQTYAGTNSKIRIVYWPLKSSFLKERFDTALVGASYLYQLINRFDYNVGTVQYSDFGTPTSSIQMIGFESEPNIDGSSTALYSMSLSQIPVLANASGDNYATSAIVKEIYRTTNGGNIFYKAGSIANATTSFTDTVLDSVLLDNATLYTTGGVSNNDTPPISKYIHILDNIAYYGNVTESTEANTHRLRQSIADDPDSCPTSFFLDFDQAITGISSAKSNLIVGCTNSMHRVSGFFDEFGRGGMTRESISDSVGCINHESMVKTDIGVFWAGNNGFYYTDGYQVLRVSPHLEATFLSYTSSQNQKDRLTGCYKRNNRKVMWTLQSTSGGASADIIWELDLDQGIRAEMPFTTWSGRTNFSPTALTYFSGQLVRGTANGYVLKHDSTYNMDPKIDTAVAATSWTVESILWDFKSSDHDYGTGSLRKYFTRIYTQFKESTNLSVGITTDIDRGRTISNLTPIRSRKLADWGDANVATPVGFVAKTGSIIDEFRRTASGSLKANFMSVELKNGYVVITSSDVAGVATLVDLGGSTFSATLTVVGKKWPNYVIDYYLRLNGVDYLVTTRTSDTVIACNGAPSIAAGVAWELWGYPKNEHAFLIDYTVRYDLMSDKTKDYGGPVSDGGQNA